MTLDSSDGISRRKFLGITVGAVVIAGVGCGEDDKNAANAATGGTSSATGGGVSTGGSASSTGGATSASNTATNSGGTTTSSGGTSGTSTASSGVLVALVRSADVIQATIDAIEAAGGFPDLTGKTVLLRPNAIDAAPPGSTNPDVIRGVIRAIKAKGTPTSIVVADDTFTGATLERMAANGIQAAVEDEGATCAGLEGGDATPVAVAAATAWSGTVDFYDDVLNADYVVNIPVCKTHGNANFSMALKAWYGNTPTRNHNHNNVTTISNVMAEMHLVRQEDFVVLDATQCLLTGGPQVGNGTTASPGIVVASRDAIAADVTGLCIIKHYLEQTGTSNSRITNSGVWEQPQIARAMALALPGWLTAKQNFEYVATGIDEAATILAYRD